MTRNRHFCGQLNFSFGKYILNLTCPEWQLKYVGLSATLAVENINRVCDKIVTGAYLCNANRICKMMKCHPLL